MKKERGKSGFYLCHEKGNGSSLSGGGKGERVSRGGKRGDIFPISLFRKRRGWIRSEKKGKRGSHKGGERQNLYNDPAKREKRKRVNSVGGSGKRDGAGGGESYC